MSHQQVICLLFLVVFVTTNVAFRLQFRHKVLLPPNKFRLWSSHTSNNELSTISASSSGTEVTVEGAHLHFLAKLDELGAIVGRPMFRASDSSEELAKSILLSQSFFDGIIHSHSRSFFLTDEHIAFLIFAFGSSRIPRDDIGRDVWEILESRLQSMLTYRDTPTAGDAAGPNISNDSDGPIADFLDRGGAPHNTKKQKYHHHQQLQQHQQQHRYQESPKYDNEETLPISQKSAHRIITGLAGMGIKFRQLHPATKHVVITIVTDMFSYISQQHQQRQQQQWGPDHEHEESEGLSAAAAFWPLLHTMSKLGIKMFDLSFQTRHICSRLLLGALDHSKHNLNAVAAGGMDNYYTLVVADSANSDSGYDISAIIYDLGLIKFSATKDFTAAQYRKFQVSIAKALDRLLLLRYSSSSTVDGSGPTPIQNNPKQTYSSNPNSNHSINLSGSVSVWKLLSGLTSLGFRWSSMDIILRQPIESLLQRRYSGGDGLGSKIDKNDKNSNNNNNNNNNYKQHVTTAEVALIIESLRDAGVKWSAVEPATRAAVALAVSRTCRRWTSKVLLRSVAALADIGCSLDVFDGSSSSSSSASQLGGAVVGRQEDHGSSSSGSSSSSSDISSGSGSTATTQHQQQQSNRGPVTRVMLKIINYCVSIHPDLSSSPIFTTWEQVQLLSSLAVLGATLEDLCSSGLINRLSVSQAALGPKLSASVMLAVGRIIHQQQHQQQQLASSGASFTTYQRQQEKQRHDEHHNKIDEVGEITAAARDDVYDDEDDYKVLQIEEEGEQFVKLTKDLVRKWIFRMKAPEVLSSILGALHVTTAATRSTQLRSQKKAHQQQQPGGAGGGGRRGGGAGGGGGGEKSISTVTEDGSGSEADHAIAATTAATGAGGVVSFLTTTGGQAAAAVSGRSGSGLCDSFYGVQRVGAFGLWFKKKEKGESSSTSDDDDDPDPIYRSTTSSTTSTTTKTRTTTKLSPSSSTASADGSEQLHHHELLVELSEVLSAMDVSELTRALRVLLDYGATPLILWRNKEIGRLIEGSVVRALKKSVSTESSFSPGVSKAPVVSSSSRQGGQEEETEEEKELYKFESANAPSEVMLRQSAELLQVFASLCGSWEGLRTDTQTGILSWLQTESFLNTLQLPIGLPNNDCNTEVSHSAAVEDFKSSAVPEFFEKTLEPKLISWSVLRGPSPRSLRYPSAVKTLSVKTASVPRPRRPRSDNSLLPTAAAATGSFVPILKLKSLSGREAETPSLFKGSSVGGNDSSVEKNVLPTGARGRSAISGAPTTEGGVTTAPAGKKVYDARIPRVALLFALGSLRVPLLRTRTDKVDAGLGLSQTFCESFPRIFTSLLLSTDTSKVTKPGAWTTAVGEDGAMPVSSSFGKEPQTASDNGGGIVSPTTEGLKQGSSSSSSSTADAAVIAAQGDVSTELYAALMLALTGMDYTWSSATSTIGLSAIYGINYKKLKPNSASSRSLNLAKKSSRVNADNLAAVADGLATIVRTVNTTGGTPLHHHRSPAATISGKTTSIIPSNLSRQLTRAAYRFIAQEWDGPVLLSRIIEALDHSGVWRSVTPRQSKDTAIYLERTVDLVHTMTDVARITRLLPSLLLASSAAPAARPHTSGSFNAVVDQQQEKIDVIFQALSSELAEKALQLDESKIALEDEHLTIASYIDILHALACSYCSKIRYETYRDAVLRRGDVVDFPSLYSLGEENILPRSRPDKLLVRRLLDFLSSHVHSFRIAELITALKYLEALGVAWKAQTASTDAGATIGPDDADDASTVNSAWKSLFTEDEDDGGDDGNKLQGVLQDFWESTARTYADYSYSGDRQKLRMRLESMGVKIDTDPHPPPQVVPSLSPSQSQLLSETETERSSSTVAGAVAPVARRGVPEVMQKTPAESVDNIDINSEGSDKDKQRSDEADGSWSSLDQLRDLFPSLPASYVPNALWTCYQRGFYLRSLNDAGIWSVIDKKIAATIPYWDHMHLKLSMLLNALSKLRVKAHQLSQESQVAIASSLLTQMRSMNARTLSNVLYYAAKLDWPILQSTLASTSTSASSPPMTQASTQASTQIPAEVIRTALLSKCKYMLGAGEFPNAFWAWAQITKISWSDLKDHEVLIIEDTLQKLHSQFNGRDLATILGALRSMGASASTMSDRLRDLLLEKVEEAAVVHDFDKQSIALTLFSLGNMGFNWDTSFTAVTRMAMRNCVTTCAHSLSSRELYWSLMGLGKLGSRWEAFRGTDMLTVLSVRVAQLFADPSLQPRGLVSIFVALGRFRVNWNDMVQLLQSFYPSIPTSTAAAASDAAPIVSVKSDSITTAVSDIGDIEESRPPKGAGKRSSPSRHPRPSPAAPITTTNTTTPAPSPSSSHPTYDINSAVTLSLRQALPLLSDDETFQVLCSLGRVKRRWTDLDENAKRTISSRLVARLQKLRPNAEEHSSVENDTNDSGKKKKVYVPKKSMDTKSKNARGSASGGSGSDDKAVLSSSRTTMVLEKKEPSLYQRYAKECLTALCKLGVTADTMTVSLRREVTIAATEMFVPCDIGIVPDVVKSGTMDKTFSAIVPGETVPGTLENYTLSSLPAAALHWLSLLRIPWSSLDATQQRQTIAYVRRFVALSASGKAGITSLVATMNRLSAVGATWSELVSTDKEKEEGNEMIAMLTDIIQTLTPSSSSTRPSLKNTTRKSSSSSSSASVVSTTTIEGDHTAHNDDSDRKLLELLRVAVEQLGGDFSTISTTTTDTTTTKEDREEKDRVLANRLSQRVGTLSDPNLLRVVFLLGQRRFPSDLLRKASVLQLIAEDEDNGSVQAMFPVRVLDATTISKRSATPHIIPRPHQPTTGVVLTLLDVRLSQMMEDLSPGEIVALTGSLAKLQLTVRDIPRTMPLLVRNIGFLASSLDRRTFMSVLRSLNSMDIRWEHLEVDGKAGYCAGIARAATARPTLTQLTTLLTVLADFGLSWEELHTRIPIVLRYVVFRSFASLLVRRHENIANVPQEIPSQLPSPPHASSPSAARTAGTMEDSKNAATVVAVVSPSSSSSSPGTGGATTTAATTATTAAAVLECLSLLSKLGANATSLGRKASLAIFEVTSELVGTSLRLNEEATTQQQQQQADDLNLKVDTRRIMASPDQHQQQTAVRSNDSGSGSGSGYISASSDSSNYSNNSADVDTMVLRGISEVVHRLLLLVEGDGADSVDHQPPQQSQPPVSLYIQ